MSNIASFMTDGFLSHKRLIKGPWQALERDFARLMVANGFQDVRIIGGTGDHGGDVLGARNGELWVVQVKFTSESGPSRDAIKEVVDAGKYYGAQRMVVAASRHPTDSFWEEVKKYLRLKIKVEVVGPTEILSLMNSTPEYPPNNRKLRDYQEVAFQNFRNGLVDTGKGQIILATGLGKTVVMAETVASLLRDGLIQYGRCLVLAHTKELVDQLQKSFWFHLPKWVHTHRLSDGEVPSYWDGITFATVQSVYSRREDLPKFGLVLIDEAHHLGAKTFLDTILTLDPPMIGGVTATPWRGDAYDIDHVLGPPLFKMGIAEGLAKGFLAEVDYRILADNLNWEFVQEASKFKYSLTQLNRKLIIPTRDEIAVRNIKDIFEKTKRRAGIVFSPTILHSHAFTATLRKYNFEAEVVSSDTEPRDREQIMSRFRSGMLQFVVTVDLFNEGVDVPDVDLIVFMRATHSRRIFVQQLGRGLRPSPLKDRVVVLDFVTDLRRVAEVLELDRSLRNVSVERLNLGGQLIEFSDRTAGTFLTEWMLDQADLMLREGDPSLQLPKLNYPEPPGPGAVQ